MTTYKAKIVVTIEVEREYDEDHWTEVEGATMNDKVAGWVAEYLPEFIDGSDICENTKVVVTKVEEVTP